MKKLKLIPTPQYVDYKEGQTLSISKVYVCKCVGNSVNTALELLAKKTEFVISEKSEADVLITLNPEKYFSTTDYKKSGILPMAINNQN